MSRETYVLCIDQGTSSTKVLVIDSNLRVRSSASVEFPQHYPAPGLVEHELEEIWTSVQRAIPAALEKADVRGEEIGAIGITNQRETTALWERGSGRAFGRAIVWQDRRTASRCEALEAQGHGEMIREKTGLVIDPYFSATKLEWMLENRSGARAAAEAGKLCFGTIDSYLMYRLSGNRRHLTDVSNASRSLLMDIRRLAWDEDLLALFGIPEALLPEIRPSSGLLAETQGVAGLPDGIPIAGVAGDQQAALFGQTCFEVGDSKCTYGTGAFLLANTGETPVASRSGLLTTVAWKLGEAAPIYALEGASFVAGAAVKWLRDGLGLIQRSADVEALAASVPDSGGVVFVPALAGLGAPHWKPHARGAFLGLHQGTTKAHLARATLEGVALQLCDLAACMEADLGRPLRSYRVDGGAARNDLLMQMQADLLGQELTRPQVTDTTAMGAGMLAGLGVGLFPSREAIAKAWAVDRRFPAEKDAPWRRTMRARWEEALRACVGFAAGGEGRAGSEPKAAALQSV